MRRRGLATTVAALAIIAGFIWGGGGFASEEVACGTTVTTGNTANEIETKIGSAPNGSTFCLTGGTYPELHTKGAHKTSTLTIRSKPGETAKVAGFRIYGGRHLRLSNITFTEGVKDEDSETFPGSENLEVVEDTFEKTLYAVRVGGITGTPMKHAVIEHDFIEKPRIKKETVPCEEGEGEVLHIATAEDVAFRHNTILEGDPGHYVQGAATGAAGTKVENNLFVGKYIPSCERHLNAWQIFQGGENFSFRNNIIWAASPSEPAEVISLQWQNGGNGAECEVGKLKNGVFENNLFVNPSTSNLVQIETVENLTIKNNTGVRYTAGIKLNAASCGNSKHLTETHNIMVEGQESGAERAGFNGFNCTEECLFDYNVSGRSGGDESAKSLGSPTHYVVNWTPAWESTSWNPVAEIEGGNKFPDPPSTYYKATGLEFESGYQGGGGP